MRVRSPRIEGNGETGGWQGTHQPQVAEFTPYGIIHGAEASTMRTITPWHLVASVEFDKANLITEPSEPGATTTVAWPEEPPQVEQVQYRPKLPEQFVEGRYRNLVVGDILALPVTKDGEPTGEIRARGLVIESEETVGEDARQYVVKVRRLDRPDTVATYTADPSAQCYVENPEWRRWQNEGEARLPDGARIRRED